MRITTTTSSSSTIPWSCYLFIITIGILLLLTTTAQPLRAASSSSDDDDHITPQEETPEPKNIKVTCGSIVKLRHKGMNCRLHSHAVKYGSGSGQQSVTCFPGEGDENSYWVIKGAYSADKKGEDSCPHGTVLKTGLTVRLEHAQTGGRLHSHLHLSPLSRQQEVSCYEGQDTGDNWIVELVSSSSNALEKGDSFRLKHVDTGKYLHSHNMQYGNPIPGQLEVTCVGSSNSNTIWVAEEGVYYPTQKELENHH
ncbi:hypothetical protein FDP41_006852 [Naegleria fowleri]|uniref:MIR domain-containing protein n=1 Tax=Naegleria fowleri TaxID=5763 RepID=A0A6A5BHG0_NAEFO|nr:uncharacterized protein FDP41_006852 [Naegleria fowleri]KAF0974242.1 hypothetical protein FDP41_006852 [Naegleria fowleri]CAG4709979.1 unnamed protein product [Naegleria fowleri]